VSIRERIAFWSQFRREFVATGAIQPSSRFLAREMTRPMRRDPRPPGMPRNIVEMGPGTGAITRHIARTMRAGDRLDCYEINPRFASFLERAVGSHAAYAQARDRIRVHCTPAEEAAPTGPVDFVICSIPLNNLPPVAVRRIFVTGFEMLEHRGWFTYFEYPWLPQIRGLFASAEERRRSERVRDVKREFASESALSHLALLNLPPARAVHIPGGPRPYGEAP
jgi:phosphatidylethanolamine/phosphatidyl-N-methylethanolamine N-methyltransferase